MADGAQLGQQDDELDFQPTPPKPAPQVRQAAVSDGIDFQPVNAAPKPQRSAVPASSDGLDFQPAEKPATFESVYPAPGLGTPTLTERAAHLGGPSPAIQSFAPKTFDLTSVPRSPFTNQLELAPPIATEEEKQRQGTIAPRPLGIGERVERALGAGAPVGSKMAEWTGQPGTKDNLRLFAPEQLMTESEQARHPILTGAGEFAGGFTSPESIMLLAGTAGAGTLAGPAGQTVKELLAAGFTASMLASAVQQVPEVARAIQTGDSYNAQRLLTHLALTTATAGLAGRGIFEEPKPLTVPKGTISGKLAIDEASVRAARRFADFEANQAAREGMGRLTEAERGIEAARQARINAPVEVPKTYEGEPPIFPGRLQGPERNPLEVEAGRVREERAARERPGFNVRDLRRVVPENPEEPPYYEIAPTERQAPSGSLIAPPVGETIGLQPRSATVSRLAERVLTDREKSLSSKYGPDVLEDARQELQAAAGLAGSFERPGRYFAAVGQADEHFIREEPKLGIRHGGVWYGVTSGRPSIEAMHPWYRDVLEGPETLSRIAQEGKGAAYDRILERVATHIQNERESARPIIEEYAPQLRDLAGQVQDVDPNLSQTLQDIAGGKAVGFRNLREYIEGKITDAQTAAEFSRAIDEAAAEARGEASAEEAAGPRGAVRERESASARELDFLPLAEPQPREAGFPNASAESGASLEAIKRAREERGAGVQRVRIDTRSGRETPLIGPEAVDVQPGPYDRIVQRGGDGTETLVAEGPEAKAMPVRTQEPMRPAREEEPAVGVVDLGEIGAVPARRGREGVLPGMETAVREQREAAATEQGRQLTERANRPPESIEERAGLMETQSPLFRGKGPQAELYSGVNPKALVEGARVLQRAWEDKIARPFIDRIAKIGDKYEKAREADPAVAEGLHLLDNAPQYLRAKAAQEVHNVIGDLSRAQEQLFVLMADANSRENLRTNHPQEFAQAENDPAIQEALKAYRPLERELTDLRQRMGGATIDDDYLRRVYDKYIAGVGHAEAPGTPERATSAYDRVIRPQRIGNMGREAEAEYYYQHGLHEFGPSFATKYIATHLRALRDSVAREFMNKGTFVPTDGAEPRFILYNGERYYRPDFAREMRSGGVGNVKEYDRYDPTAGEKFPVPAEGKYLGPKDLVKTLNDFGRREESEPGALRRFFQEQIIGFGFGIPHVANIMRRVSQSVPGGAVNPQGWVRAWSVVLSKELRDRGIAGLNDPTFDMLAQRGAISTGEWANLKEYWGGNLNPANWARQLAQVGHKVLFEPETAKGFGGIDQRARIYIADLLKSQRPELTDSQIAEAVRTQLGDYNRANWSDRQKMLARFMMFPGWDFSSMRWVMQHPVKTTVPPALMVLLANQALHQLGQNRPEDQYDIQNIHIGDRAYGTSLVRESVGRNLFRPALAYAQAKIQGESDQRALAEASHGISSGAGGLLSMLRPDLSGFLALATNRQGLFSSKEIVSRDDYAQPGKILPSRAVEKQAVFALRQAIPPLSRMLNTDEEIDLRAFAGGNLGVPNYRDDAEKRLIRNAAEAREVHSTIAKLAKSNPELAREYVKDPDNAAFALFSHDLEAMAGTLKRIDEAKQRIEASGLPDADKKRRLETIEKSRENLLRNADGLSNLLFERRQKAASPSLLRGLPGLLGGQPTSPRVASPMGQP